MPTQIRRKKTTAAPRRPAPKRTVSRPSAAPPAKSAARAMAKMSLSNYDGPRGIVQRGPDAFSADLASYAAAQFFPFSDAAVGARVPEPYAVRTRTTRVVTPFRVTPVGGVMDAIITPNVLNTVTSNLGSWSGGAPAQLIAVTGAVTLTPDGQVPSNVLAVTNQANLAACYSNYRVVGCGVRIKTDSSYVNTAGRIFVAVVPSMPSALAFVDSVAGIPDVYASLGAPFDGAVAAVNGQIVSYPMADEFSVTQLMENGGVEIMIPKTSARAMDFLPGNIYTQNNGDGWQGFALQGSAGAALNGGTQFEGTSTTVAGNAQLKSAGHKLNGTWTNDYSNLARCGVDPNIYSTAGFSTVLIRGDGLDANTVLTVETVFHLEGEVGVVTSTGASTVLVDDSVRRAVGPRASVDMVEMAATMAHPICVGLKECGRAVLPAVRAYLASGKAGAVAKGAAAVIGLLA